MCCPGRHSVSHSTEEEGWFGSRRKSGLIPACAGMVACAALIMPVRVPHELSDHVALELSGNRQDVGRHGGHPTTDVRRPIVILGRFAPALRKRQRCA